MKTTTLLLFAAMIAYKTVHTQTLGYLDINNVKAGFWSDGDMFWDKLGSPLYNWPKDSNTNINNATGIWLIGNDQNGSLMGASGQYGSNGRDWYPGPLTNNGTIDSNTMALYDQVWKLDKTEIDQFILCHCQNPSAPQCDGYSIPASITNWPGNPIVEADGDHLLMDKLMAPFHDENNDGEYNPQDCDYPVIKCDQALFYVFNDRGGNHMESQLPSVGFQVKAMAYACSCNTTLPFLNDVIFLDLAISHKGTDVLYKSYLGLFSDGDIGGPADDYSGTDVDGGYTYLYNGDTFDGDFNGVFGYGSTPPAQGYVLLEGPWMDANNIDDVFNPADVNSYTDTTLISSCYGINGSGFNDGIADNEKLGMTRSTYFNNSSSSTGGPTNGMDYYNYLTSYWRDNSSFIYGGSGYPTGPFASAPRYRFIYPDASDVNDWGSSGTTTAFDWSETNTGSSPNTPGDRRMLLSSGPFTFFPGEVNNITYAFVSARSNSSADSLSLDTLHNAVVELKSNYYASQLACNGYLTTNNNQDISVTLYPNPATDLLFIQGISGNNISISIIDISGRTVYHKTGIGNSSDDYITIPVQQLSPGVYSVLLNNGSLQTARKFIRQ